MRKGTAIMKQDPSFTTDPPPAEPLDTMDDVARRVHCHKRTIARAVADGLLHPVRFNTRLIRFRRNEVERWMAQAEGGR